MRGCGRTNVQMSVVDEVDSEHPEMSETKKKSRNASEKKRRDSFNLLISELRGMVTNGDRKLDKSNVLKQTINFLKVHNQTNSTTGSEEAEKWKPPFLSSQEYSCLMLDHLNAFVVLLTTGGLLLYASGNLAKLTQSKASLKGTSLMNLLDWNSGKELRSFLSGEVLRAASAHCVRSPAPPIRVLDLNLTTGNNGRLLPIRLMGKFRRVEMSPEEAAGGVVGPRAETLCFVCVGRPLLLSSIGAPLAQSLPDPDKREFSAIFNVEWKFISLDSKALAIIGYLPFEVLGTSGYDYYHPDDLEQIVEDHKELIQKSQVTSKPYRFLSKGQQWIRLQTRAYISLHHWNSKPEFVVTSSWVLSESDEKKEPDLDPPDALVSSTTAQAHASANNLSRVKVEPRETSVEGGSRDSKQVFRPQPGVSIEHSPIPRSPRLRTARRASTDPVVIVQEESSVAPLDPSEQRIYVQLQEHQAALQQQIVHQRNELRDLEERLVGQNAPGFSPAPTESLLTPAAPPLLWPQPPAPVAQYRPNLVHLTSSTPLAAANPRQTFHWTPHNH